MRGFFVATVTSPRGGGSRPRLRAFGMSGGLQRSELPPPVVQVQPVNVRPNPHDPPPSPASRRAGTLARASDTRPASASAFDGADHARAPASANNTATTANLPAAHDGRQHSLAEAVAIPGKGESPKAADPACGGRRRSPHRAASSGQSRIVGGSGGGGGAGTGGRSGISVISKFWSDDKSSMPPCRIAVVGPGPPRGGTLPRLARPPPPTERTRPELRPQPTPPPSRRRGSAGAVAVQPVTAQDPAARRDRRPWSAPTPTRTAASCCALGPQARPPASCHPSGRKPRQRTTDRRRRTADRTDDNPNSPSSGPRNLYRQPKEPRAQSSARKSPASAPPTGGGGRRGGLAATIAARAVARNPYL